MTGKRKRKNLGVGIDFRKAKRKVGKKLVKAQNATDTNIKTRSIHVPNQLAAEGGAVSKRQVTLKELITQAGHYNCKIRRDAFDGLAELFRSSPSELKGQLSSVMYLVGEHICDGDSSVRAVVHGFLVKTVLNSVDAQSISPFLPILLAHVGSALTNSDNSITADGVKFLSLLLKEYGSVICASHFVEMLTHFVHLLGEARSTKKLNSKAQMRHVEVLDTLGLLFKDITQSVTHSLPKSCNTGSIFNSRCCQLRTQTTSVSHNSEDAVNSKNIMKQLLLKLKSILDSNLLFLEDLSEAEDESLYQSIIIKCLKCVSSIVKGMSIENIQSDHETVVALKAICEILKSQFPWYSDSGDSSERCSLIGSFNLEAAEALTLLWKLQIQTIDSTTSQQLNQFYNKMLNGVIENPKTGWKSAELMLGTLESWMEPLGSSEQTEMLMIVIECCVKLINEPQTQLKLLMLLHRTIQSLNIQTKPDIVFIKFLQILPEMLWKTNKKSVENIEICLQILHFISRIGSEEVLQILADLQPQFYLFIFIRQEKEGLSRFAPGPVLQWPDKLQLLFLDCLYFFPGSKSSPIDIYAIKFLCQSREFPLCFVCRMLTVASMKYEFSDRKMIFQKLFHELLNEDDYKQMERVRSEVVSLIIRERLADNMFTFEILKEVDEMGRFGIGIGLSSIAQLVSANFDTLEKSDQTAEFKNSFSKLIIMWFVQIYERSVANAKNIEELDTSLENAFNQSGCTEISEWISMVSLNTEIVSWLIQSSRAMIEKSTNDSMDNPVTISALLLTLIETESLNETLVTEKEAICNLVATLEQLFTKHDPIPILFVRLTTLLKHFFRTSEQQI